jgi:predicted O-methyltransferase YrrM
LQLLIIKNIVKKIIPVIDVLFSPVTFLSTVWLLVIRKLGIGRMSVSNSIFNKIGLLPIHNHYYQPLINPKKHSLKSFREDRLIGCLDFNIDQQKEIISSFNYENELLKFPLTKSNNKDYFYHNRAFESGDSEYLYSIVRKFKPKIIIEIGSGFSTKMMLNGIEKNKELESEYSCELTCIEPYEFGQLDGLPITLIKEKVESLDLKIFKELKQDDILFIDSSHIIKPQGDVLFEIQCLLPELNPGVLIHFHDIFTPKDYLDDWIVKDHRLWNEQYLLEAFLSCNHQFEIIGSLNYLKHNYWDLFSSKFPVVRNESIREPGSFWIRKVS